MELQQLKYFKTVAAIGKISDAAEALFVSAPALSTSISRLEKELGVRLFNRTNNRIILNAQGQIFLKYVNQVFSSLEHAKQELQQSVLQQGARVSLVSINSLIWVNLITAFISEFPQYTLSHSTISIPELEENGISTQHSFLLAYESDIPPAYADKLDSVFLFQPQPAVMVHKDHPLAQAEKLELPDLAGEKLFMPAPGYSLSVRLQQLFGFYDLPFPGDNVYSYHARQKLVSENMGISFISDRTSNMQFQNVRYIPLADPLDPWVARLYWRKGHPLTEYETAFRDFTEKFYQDLH